MDYDEVIERAARAMCSADLEVRMGDAEGVVQQRVNIEWVHYVGAAKAAIAAMTVQAEPQWQGIESAPRDGTLILVPVGHGVMDVVSWWGGAWRETANALAIRDEPTHWMPLPTLPAGGSDAE